MTKFPLPCFLLGLCCALLTAGCGQVPAQQNACTTVALTYIPKLLNNPATADFDRKASGGVPLARTADFAHYVVHSGLTAQNSYGVKKRLDYLLLVASPPEGLYTGQVMHHEETRPEPSRGIVEEFAHQHGDFGEWIFAWEDGWRAD